ncbi:MAG: ATP-binding protein [Polyangia bacterium]|jgi:predicted AAA+ superfamily ATPase|nr:ATP-binding protein [Polyangia bacterium]
MDADIRRTVEHLNPWIEDPTLWPAVARERLPERLIPRSSQGELEKALEDPNKAHLIIGPRQSGKGTLVWTLAGRASHMLFLNCEEPLVRQWCSSPAQLVHEARAFLPKGGLLFVEEAQWLAEAGLLVKGIIDARPGWRVAVTGSASFHLMSKTRESLAGRATRHHVWPLSLAEAVPEDDQAQPASLLASRRTAMEKLLLYGGYPEVWTSSAPEEVLRELVSAFVIRDASDRFRVTRPDAFRLLMRLAAGQVCDLVNYSEWARILGISPPTVSEYIGLLEETHILRLVRPFVGGRRAEVTSAPKVFFIDNGLRNMVAGGFEPLEQRSDRGKLLENWVLGELHKRYPEPGAIRYWRSKGGAEVDFVLETSPGRLIGIEVKARQKGPPRLTRSTRSFIEVYRPSEQIIVHRAEAYEDRLGDTRVRWVPAEQLPEVLP